MLLHQLCPFLGRVAVVERGVRYRLAEGEAHRLAPLGKHLARQQRHLEIELNPQPLAPVGDGIETAAVALIMSGKKN